MVGVVFQVYIFVHICEFSSEFCEKHLPLLFTILEKSSNAVVRANTVIALGDLTVRFPNLIEPWTSHIYARSVIFISWITDDDVITFRQLQSSLRVV